MEEQAKFRSDLVNIIGEKKGGRTVIGLIRNEKGQPRWIVRCECGEETMMERKCWNILKNDFCKRCMTRKEHVGARYGKLTITEYLYNGRVLSVCDCGEKDVKRCLGNMKKNPQTQKCDSCIKLTVGKDHPSWKGRGDLPHSIWNHIERDAHVRSLDITITIDDAWKQFEKQKGICALTGVKLKFNVIHNDHAKCSASLDRVDSSKGYHKDNIQWVHKMANRSKGAMPNDHFIAMCYAVTKHHAEKFCDNETLQNELDKFLTGDVSWNWRVNREKRKK